MIIFVAIIGLLCLYNIKLPLNKNASLGYENGIYTDYMSLEKTTSIKGIFILIVFISHSLGYLSLSNFLLDKTGEIFISRILGQSMVAPFLFYSGYGVMLSIEKKGKEYVKSIPKKRVLKVLIHFDIALLLFILLDVLTNQELTLSKILLSFVAWDSIGNSNWYIFDILVLYLFTYISFLIGSKNKYFGLIINFILCMALVLFFWKTKEEFWYDTIFCYPIGMLFYIIKPWFDNFIKKHNLIYWLLFIAALCICCICVLKGGTLFSILKNTVFACLIVLITMKFSINNKILNFCGKHLFSMYILQRIPMNLLSYFKFENRYLFIVISVVITILLAVAFDFAMTKLDSALFKTKIVEK